MTVQRQLRRPMISRPQLDPNNPAFQVIGERESDGLCSDISGNSLDGTPSGAVGIVAGRKGVGSEFYGGEGVVTLPTDTSYLGLSQVTHVLRFMYRGLGGGNTGRLLTIYRGATEQTTIRFTGTREVLIAVRYTDGLATWSSAEDIPLSPNLVNTMVVIIDRTDPSVLPIVEVNGEALTMAVVAGMAGTQANDAGGIARIGNNQALTRGFDGVIYEATLIPTSISAAQRRAEYLQKALRVVELAPREARPETMGAPSSVQSGPWLVGSGSFSWEDDGTRRRNVNAVDGWAFTHSAQAYGAWYLRAMKAGAGNAVAYLFVASSRQSRSGATQVGYELTLASTEAVQIRRRNNGVVATTIINSGIDYIVVGVEYEFFITRRSSDGLFGLWIRGGIYNTWTLVGNGSNTVVTESNYMVDDMDTADELSDVLLYPEGYSLDPTSDVIPGLAA